MWKAGDEPSTRESTDRRCKGVERVKKKNKKLKKISGRVMSIGRRGDFRRYSSSIASVEYNGSYRSWMVRTMDERI